MLFLLLHPCFFIVCHLPTSSSLTISYLLFSVFCRLFLHSSTVSSSSIFSCLYAFSSLTSLLLHCVPFSYFFFLNYLLPVVFCLLSPLLALLLSHLHQSSLVCMHFLLLHPCFFIVYHSPTSSSLTISYLLFSVFYCLFLLFCCLIFINLLLSVCIFFSYFPAFFDVTFPGSPLTFSFLSSASSFALLLPHPFQSFLVFILFLLLLLLLLLSPCCISLIFSHGPFLFFILDALPLSILSSPHEKLLGMMLLPRPNQCLTLFKFLDHVFRPLRLNFFLDIQYYLPSSSNTIF